MAVDAPPPRQVEMDDSAKTREELIRELQSLRHQVAQLESRAGQGLRASSPAGSPGPAGPGAKTASRPHNITAPGEAAAWNTANLASPDTERSFREVKDLLRDVVARAPIVLWALDRDGVFMLSEGETLRVLGLEPGEVVGQSIYDVYRDVPEIAEYTRRALAGESITGTTEVGGVVFATWHAPLHSASGKMLGVVGVAIDVTKQKQAEEALLAEQRLLEEMLRSHERDRRLIAYEIHDGLVQDATGAKMHLEALLRSEQAPTGRARDEMELALDLVSKAIVEARQLIGGLRPPVLDELGVLAAIEYLIRDQTADGPTIEFKARVQFERLEPLLEATIYRIVQEAVTNVRRHSRSDRAEIRLTQVEDRIHVEIRDWGIGFDPDRVEGKRFGLRGIRERARLLRGRAVIESAPGKGSRVFIDLPVAGVPKEVAVTNDRSIE